MKFILIRHAETTANAGAIILGGKEGGTLSARGRRQAKAISRRLAKEKIKEVYCSTSKRCIETAKAVMVGRQCRFFFCEELREIETGKLTGLSHEEAEERYSAVFERMFEFPSRKLPGGESLEDVQRRVMPLIRKLAKKKGNPTIFAVGHNVANRVILASLIGLPLNKARSIKQKNACINLLDVTEGSASLYSVDNSLHSIR